MKKQAVSCDFSQSGFTLVEILVATALLGILAAVFGSMMLSNMNNVRTSESRTEIQAAFNGLQLAFGTPQVCASLFYDATNNLITLDPALAATPPVPDILVNEIKSPTTSYMKLANIHGPFQVGSMTFKDISLIGLKIVHDYVAGVDVERQQWTSNLELKFNQAPQPATKATIIGSSEKIYKVALNLFAEKDPPYAVKECGIMPDSIDLQAICQAFGGVFTPGAPQPCTLPAGKPMEGYVAKSKSGGFGNNVSDLGDWGSSNKIFDLQDPDVAEGKFLELSSQCKAKAGWTHAKVQVKNTAGNIMSEHWLCSADADDGNPVKDFGSVTIPLGTNGGSVWLQHEAKKPGFGPNLGFGTNASQSTNYWMYYDAAIYK